MKKTIKLKKEDILPLLEGMIKEAKGEVNESYGDIIKLYSNLNSEEKNKFKNHIKDK